MLALTIWQPWASLIMIGAKPYEFRGKSYLEYRPHPRPGDRSPGVGADALNGGPLLESANHGDRLALSAAGTWTAERAGEQEPNDERALAAYRAVLAADSAPVEVQR